MSNIAFPAYSSLVQSKASPTGLTATAQPGAKEQASPVEQGVSTFRDSLQAAEAAALDTAVNGADPHAMVHALAQAEIALSAAVTMRDKVVEAYNELLRMPV